MNRRELLRSAVRWLALLGLTAGAALLGRTRVRAACPGVSPCAGCDQLAYCGLPRAATARAGELAPRPSNL